MCVCVLIVVLSLCVLGCLIVFFLMCTCFCIFLRSQMLSLLYLWGLNIGPNIFKGICEGQDLVLWLGLGFQL